MNVAKSFKSYLQVTMLKKLALIHIIIPSSGSLTQWLINLVIKWPGYLFPTWGNSDGPSYLFKIFWKILFTFRECRREEEREGEKHQCVVTSDTPITGDLARNPGIWPEWELNQWPFGSWAGTQCTEPHQSGHDGPSYLYSTPRVPFLLGVHVICCLCPVIYFFHCC